VFSGSALTPLYWFFEALTLASFVVEAWALIDAIRRPAAAFQAAGKQTKQLWLIILGVAAAIGLAYSAFGGVALLSILPIAAFVAAAIYLTDVRPKVREFRGGNSSTGPYGPW
jgi:predicted cobalt transporter CbtA